MSYVSGFLTPVPVANKAAYIAAAKAGWEMFKRYGALSMTECWGDDVPDGKVTDYKGAVQAKPDETIVYSWIEWPSRKARDEGWDKAMKDPRMQGMTMPFDGKRVIYGGFAPLLDS